MKACTQSINGSYGYYRGLYIAVNGRDGWTDFPWQKTIYYGEMFCLEVKCDMIDHDITSHRFNVSSSA